MQRRPREKGTAVAQPSLPDRDGAAFCSARAEEGGCHPGAPSVPLVPSSAPAATAGPLRALRPARSLLRPGSYRGPFARPPSRSFPPRAPAATAGPLRTLRPALSLLGPRQLLQALCTSPALPGCPSFAGPAGRLPQERSEVLAFLLLGLSLPSSLQCPSFSYAHPAPSQGLAPRVCHACL